MQIEEYRARLEAFMEALNREYYLHYSGQKEKLETSAFYSEYRDLFSADTISEFQRLLESVPRSYSRQRKTLQKFLRFAVEQHLEQGCNPLTEAVAEFESRSTVLWDGKILPYNRISNQMANEPLALRRRLLNEKRLVALENSNSLRKNRLSALRAGAHSLGFKTYLDACEFLSGVDYRNLRSEIDVLLESTEAAYKESIAASFRAALGLTLTEGHRCDVGYWTRRSEYDRFFRRECMLSSLFETLRGIGIEPDSQQNLSLDLEERPLKHPRAFCAPLRVPKEIKIVVLPRGGQDDYMSLLHEAGHAEHFAWTSESLPVEHRLCGDRGLSEVYAFFFEHLVWSKDWLRVHAAFYESGEFLRFQGLARVHLIRRYCGKLRYEIYLHEAGTPENSTHTYADILGRATGLQYDPESFLEDLDDAFYSADYLRAWIFEAQLRDYVFSKFGRTWFQSKAAGGFLKEVWETGQLYTIEELSGEIGIGKLDLQAVNDELQAVLRG